MSETKFKIGDEVIVRCYFNEMNGQQAQVIGISDDPHDDMPVMVRFHSNFREWPYAYDELEAVNS